MKYNVPGERRKMLFDPTRNPKISMFEFYSQKSKTVIQCLYLNEMTYSNKLEQKGSIATVGSTLI